MRLKPMDHFVDLLSFLGLLLLFIIPGYFYGKMPEEIPSYFDLYGQPDRFSNKESIWFLPAVGMVLLIIISFAVKYPHRYNYVQKITNGNAHHQYHLATRLFRSLRLLLIFLIIHLVYGSVQISLGNTASLNANLSILFFVSLFCLIIYSFIQAATIK